MAQSLVAGNNFGMFSDRTRMRMIERLRQNGIT